MNHPNILSLIGFHLSPTLKVAILISPWEPFGNLESYLQAEHPTAAEKMTLVRAAHPFGVYSKAHVMYPAKLVQTLRALDYLHNRESPVAHGDIKAVSRSVRP